MDAKILTALKESIAKWEHNARAEKPGVVKLAAKDCPLCDLFLDDDCVGCPVRLNSGRCCCDSTPYWDADNRYSAWALDPDNAEVRAAFHAAAQREVAFLKSLLPEEKK